MSFTALASEALALYCYRVLRLWVLCPFEPVIDSVAMRIPILMRLSPKCLENFGDYHTSRKMLNKF